MARRRTLALTEEQRRELRQHRDHDPRPLVRERCAAVLEIAEGRSAHWVARHGLSQPRPPDTVYGWLAYYASEGVVGLLAHQRGGSRRKGLRPAE